MTKSADDALEESRDDGLILPIQEQTKLAEDGQTPIKNSDVTTDSD